MRRIIRISLDTCECVMHIEHDDQTQAEVYVSRGGAARPDPSVVCAIHAALHGADPLLAHPLVHAENRLKNQVLGELTKHPKLQRVRIKDDGEIEVSLNEAKVAWSFDANRKLVLDVPSLTPAERAQALADVRKLNRDIQVR